MIVILFNPVSGRGAAREAARGLEARLRARGHEVRLLATRRDGPDEWLDEHLDAAAALLVVGGDGAVRASAGPAIRTGTPLYHVGYGTANLFAREFSMSRRPDEVVRALEARTVRRVDAAVANGHRFVLMASIGFDAEVVFDLARRRGRAISARSYVGPMIRQFARYRAAALALAVDGEDVELPGPGSLVVANCRQYIWGLNPAACADMTDGRLDAVYFPASSRTRLAGWIVRCARGRQLDHPGLIHRLGRRFEIRCAEPRRVQTDGDPLPGSGRDATAVLEVEVRPAVLPVLIPPPGSD